MSENENPGDNPAVITVRCSGEMIGILQKHHDAGNRQRTIAAADGYLSAIATWLEASVGPEAAFNILTRQVDAVTAKQARERHLQEQG
ncbi:hypothetical protein [Bosea massiliensis]|uniref:DUF5076 domain-containing protein n=1 Tax=Bosea massiliensis TaxID=151419 RepID=A0ABW0PAU9_9HYPH